MTIKAYERYTFSVVDWRSAFGRWDAAEVKLVVEERTSTENMDYLNGLAEAQDYINANQRPKD